MYIYPRLQLGKACMQTTLEIFFQSPLNATLVFFYALEISSCFSNYRPYSIGAIFNWTYELVWAVRTIFLKVVLHFSCH